MIERRRERSGSSVLRHLRNIEAKLDRINEQPREISVGTEDKGQASHAHPETRAGVRHERSSRKVPKEAPGRCRGRGDHYHWRPTREPRLSETPLSRPRRPVAKAPMRYFDREAPGACDLTRQRPSN